MRVLALLCVLLFAFPARAGPVVNVELTRLVNCSGSRGSGTYIGGDKMLTAWHVIERGRCMVDGFPVAVVAGDRRGDWAVLRVRPHRGVRVSCRGIRAGQHHLAAGYAYGSLFTIASILSTTDRSSIDEIITDLTVFTGQVHRGMSGGPVYDFAGRLVGIVNGGNDRGLALIRPLSETELCK